MFPRTRISPELIDHWPVIAVSATCLFFTFGMPAASLPFLYKSVIKEFHWTREQATMLGSLHWLSGALVSLFIGRFVERIGALRVVLATAILSGLSMVSFRFTDSIVGIAISSYHLASMVSRVLFGRFLDRFSIDGALAGYALISLSALLAFGVTGAATAILFALIRGFAHGGLIVSIPVLARHRFGHEGLGTIIGVLISLTTTGLATGNIVLARLYTVTESYTQGLIVFCLIPAVAALLLIPIRARHRDHGPSPVRD